MEEGASRSSTRYDVCVRRILDEGWLRALQVRAVAAHRYYTAPQRTVLTLDLADQAELLGLLYRLHNLGLTVLAVELNGEEPRHCGAESDQFEP